MLAHALQRRILLSTTMIVGVLTGYGGRAYAQAVGGACTGGGSTYTCSGTFAVPQSITADDAQVTVTAPGLVIDTTSAPANALTITGAGAISFTDSYSAPYSSLTAGTGYDALSITSTGDIPAGNVGSVTVNTSGTLIGDERGIHTINDGSGHTKITANGNVTGTSEAGIEATNYGTYLSITTAASTLVSGGTGINAANSGSGTTSITTYGNVTGTGGSAISAAANVGSGSLTILTGTGATLLGAKTGISAINIGDGALSITTGGNVTGTDNEGIYATSDFAGFTGGTDMTITTGAATTVSGTDGIYANNAGSGATSITANGNVYGTTNHGIAVKGYGSSIDVTTGADSTITGNSQGVFAQNFGSGPLAVTVNGDVDATIGVVTASNSSMDTTVTIGAGANVNGTYAGISSTNDGSGALRIEVNGYVNANLNADSRGIAASTYGTNLDIVTGAGSTVTSSGTGIDAINNGNGSLSVTANGDVTGTASSGISARAFYGTSLTVTTGAGTTIDGARQGILANNAGTGATTIDVNGDVNGAIAFAGISASMLDSTNANDLTITTGAGTTVEGSTGIDVTRYGPGAVNITTSGNVTGINPGGDGIYVYNYDGAVTNITVNATSIVSSTGTNTSAFAVETYYGPANLTVAGRLNGGAGGAVQFDQEGGFDNRLELHPTAVINGNVFGGNGTDTLAFGGTGSGAFNLSNIDTGTFTEQYQDFEVFEVDNGAWSFSGATTVPFTVNGGTVMGTGTFGDLTVNGGTVAPGNSIGTMTVNGAFTLGSGAVYEVEVNAAGQSDKVIVNGTVNLTGSVLRVLAESGNYKTSTDYTIIQNDGTDAVVGTFAAVTSSLAFLTPTVFYAAGDGNDVVLNLARNETLFPDVARTFNQRAVAGALEQFPTDNALFLAVLNQTASGARHAFDALSGEIHATISGMLADDSRYVREAVLGRLMQASHSGGNTQVASLAHAGPQVASIDANAMALGYGTKSLGEGMPSYEPAPLAFWTRAYGAWGDFNGDGNAATADRDLGGFVSGMDAEIGQTSGGGWRAGLATGASFSNVDVDARYSSADVETYHLGGYVGGMASVFALRGGGMWAWNDIDTSRAVVFPGFFERQKASYDADTGQLFGEVAYPTQMMGMAVEPFGGLAFVSIDTDNFREHGGALASLRGVDLDQDVGYSTLGLRAATTMLFGGSIQVVPHISAAWQHAFDDVTPGAALAFASTGIGFGIEGVPLAEDSALIDAGLDFALGENATAGVSYTGQFGNGVSDNGVKGRFTWLF